MLSRNDDVYTRSNYVCLYFPADNAILIKLPIINEYEGYLGEDDPPTPLQPSISKDSEERAFDFEGFENNEPLRPVRNEEPRRPIPIAQPALDEEAIESVPIDPRRIPTELREEFPRPPPQDPPTENSLPATPDPLTEAPLPDPPTNHPFPTNPPHCPTPPKAKLPPTYPLSPIV